MHEARDEMRTERMKSKKQPAPMAEMINTLRRLRKVSRLIWNQKFSSADNLVKKADHSFRANFDKKKRLFWV